MYKDALKHSVKSAEKRRIFVFELNKDALKHSVKSTKEKSMYLSPNGYELSLLSISKPSCGGGEIPVVLGKLISSDGVDGSPP